MEIVCHWEDACLFKTYSTKLSPDYYCGINYSCGLRRCYRKRKLFVLITAMLFLLSFLPFIYLTLLPAGFGKRSSTNIPEQQSAPFVPSATFNGQEQKKETGNDESRVQSSASGIIVSSRNFCFGLKLVVKTSLIHQKWVLYCLANLLDNTFGFFSNHIMNSICKNWENIFQSSKQFFNFYLTRCQVAHLKYVSA